MDDSLKYLANLYFVTGLATWSALGKFILDLVSHYRVFLSLPQIDSKVIILHIILFILGAILVYAGWFILKLEEDKKWFIRRR